jgi:hypothetical protein
MASIFDYTLLTQIVPAFLLIFVLIYAILQKSKLLGDGNVKIDALVSFAISVLFVVTPPARDFVVSIMPYLAVALGVMLVYLIMYGFVGGELKEGTKNMKIVFGILAGIFLVVVIFVITGAWEKLERVIGPGVWSAILLIIIIAGAVFLVLRKGK